MSVAPLSPSSRGLRWFSAGTLRSRLASGVLVNAVGRFWVMLVQLLSIPALSTQWGAMGFGVWLMLTALPTYFALGGVALGNVSATEMLRHLTAGDRTRARAAFQSGWALITLIVGALLVLFCGAWAAIVIAKPAWTLAWQDALNAAPLLALYAFFAVQANTLMLGYRGAGRYAIGTAMFEVQGLAEGLAVIAIALLGGDFVVAAAAMLVLRIVGCAWLALDLRTREPWLSLGFTHIDGATLRALAKPAFASLGLAIANALSLQGVLITLGLFVSPAATAMFAATRTLCRLPVQVSELVTRATLPELTAAYAKQDKRLLRRITLLNLATAAAIAAPAAIVFALWGDRIAALLSAGGIAFSAPVFALLALASFAQTIWQALGQNLQALNTHHRFALPLVLLAAILVATPALFQGAPNIVILVAATAAICEVLMLGWILASVRRS